MLSHNVILNDILKFIKHSYKYEKKCLTMKIFIFTNTYENIYENINEIRNL